MSTSRRRLRRLFLIFAGWTAIGLFFSTQIYFIYRVLEGKNISWLKAIRATVPDWYIWAAFAPLIVRLSRRFPFERSAWKKAVAVHSVAALLLSFIHLLLAVSLLQLVDSFYGVNVDFTRRFKFNFGFLFHWNVLTYCAIAAISYAAEYYKSSQQRKVREVHLEAQLSMAELQALKMQLHPHFLFNTLNSISSLLQTSGAQHQDVQTAKKMIARLGDFLRMTLQDSGDQKVLLNRELEFLKCYLDIEKVRFQDRLSVDLKIDPLTAQLAVPNLILQPIVENAIEHGIAPRSEPGMIQIVTRRDNGLLRLQVRDNGRGLPVGKDGESMIVREGLGLANTRARLQQLYGSGFRFDLRNRPEGGLEVILEIPAEEI